MIISLIKVLVVLVIIGKAAKSLFPKRKIVELVLEYHARMEQSVSYYLVTLRHLFRRKRYLLQIILTHVGIVVRAVERVFNRILHCLGRGDRVAHLVGQFACAASNSHHRLVGTLPVVDVFAPPPQFLERSLTLADDRRIIEIPSAVLVGHVIGLVVLPGHCPRTVFGKVLLRLSFGLRFALLFFFLLKSFYNTVDGFVPLGLRHLGKSLQRVLQMHRLGIRYKLVEHFRPV